MIITHRRPHPRPCILWEPRPFSAWVGHLSLRVPVSHNDPSPRCTTLLWPSQQLNGLHRSWPRQCPDLSGLRLFEGGRTSSCFHGRVCRLKRIVTPHVRTEFGNYFFLPRIVLSFFYINWETTTLVIIQGLLKTLKTAYFNAKIRLSQSRIKAN